MFINKLVKRKLKETDKNFMFKSKSIITENNANDEAGAVKVSGKITTQHGQLIFHKIFTESNIKPNECQDDMT